MDFNKNKVAIIGAAHAGCGLVGKSVMAALEASSRAGAELAEMAHELERGLIIGGDIIDMDTVEKIRNMGISVDDLRHILRPDMHFGLNDVENLKLSMDKLCIDDWKFEDKLHSIRKVSSSKRGFNENDILRRRKKNKQARKSRHKNR